MYDISSLCFTNKSMHQEIPQGLHPSPRGEQTMGTQIWGNSRVHQVSGRQRRLRHQHIPVSQNNLGNLGFKEGKQAPLFQESLRAGV